MADLRAQVVFQGKSNKPEDVIVNTYHFNSASTGQTAADVIRDHLVELYNVPGPNSGTRSIAWDLTNFISRVANASKIKVYNMADAQPRIPIEFSWTLAASSSTSATELPAEVALCVSMYAGVNRPKFRGRVYLGPFMSVQEDEGTTDRSRPPAAMRTAIADSFTRLRTKAANTQNLAVYSRVDGVSRPVTAGWIDDAWDTQRRRGQDAVTRNVW